MTPAEAARAIETADGFEAVVAIYARALAEKQVPSLGWEPINFAVDAKVGREHRNTVKLAAQRIAWKQGKQGNRAARRAQSRRKQ